MMLRLFLHVWRATRLFCAIVIERKREESERPRLNFESATSEKFNDGNRIAAVFVLSLTSCGFKHHELNSNKTPARWQRNLSS